MSVFGKTKHYITENELMLTGVEAYKKLQYDPLIDQYAVYTEKIIEFNNVLRGLEPDEKNIEKMSKIMEQLTKVTVAREKLQEIILRNEESGAKIHGHGTGTEGLSMLEQFGR
jgi:hypothetical protein